MTPPITHDWNAWYDREIMHRDTQPTKPVRQRSAIDDGIDTRPIIVMHAPGKPASFTQSCGCLTMAIVIPAALAFAIYATGQIK